MSGPESIISYLRERGERLTVPRRLVIEALHSQAGHMTIHDIRRFVEKNHPGYSLQDATIYRILQWLKGLQLVCQTDMGSLGIVYAFVGDPPHHHLICLDCGHIVEVEDAFFTQLRDALSEGYDFEARIEHMAIYGRCRACSDRERKS